MRIHVSLACVIALAPVARADDEPKTPEERIAMHEEASQAVADEQDELSADVQQLVIEQTNPKVIELLAEVEDIMDEATERLIESDTGGETLAAQTEIIEKIHAAAKERQSSGQGKSGGAMMDMMERMVEGKSDGGKKPGKGKEGEGEGDGEGESGGKGQTGLSDAANEAVGGGGDGKSEERRVPKAAGAAGSEMPEEFRKAFDAYNRGAEEKVK
jgi:hypothetical protein